MPEYSPLVVLFICMHLIGLSLLSTLIYIILKSGPFVTKWTLFQLYVCGFILSLSSLPSVILYGNSLQHEGLDSYLCIFQAKIIFFIYTPLKLLPAFLSIILWFMVVRSNYNLEQKYFWYFSGMMWIVTVLYSIIRLVLDSKKENWGVRAGVLICNENFQRAMFDLVLGIILVVTSLLITAHSSYILLGRWRSFNRKQNRRTAINLGYAVRLTVLSAFYLVTLLVSIIPVIVEDSENKDKFVDFAPSFFGTILFTIFGTTKSAAFFLPCCYYVHPHEPMSQPITILLPPSLESESSEDSFIIPGKTDP